MLMHIACFVYQFVYLVLFILFYFLQIKLFFLGGKDEAKLNARILDRKN